MTEKSPSELIQNLMAERLGWEPQGTLLGRLQGPFDISQPNIHQNKADFLYELDAVNTVVKNSTEIINKLFKKKEGKTQQHSEMVDKLIPAINIHGLKLLSNETPSNASDLAQKNVIECGFYWGSLVTLFNMRIAYIDRLIELKDQEAEFWSDKHRPPNHYARAIALRFARFYAKQTKKKPTFGTSRDGPHPSTDYGRLLEEIFSILDIKSALRNPATFAIEQITEEDLKPQLPSLSELGRLHGIDQKKPTEGIYNSMLKSLDETEK